MVAEQLTAGGAGTVNWVKSMCCASLQTLTTVDDALHAYCAGVAPFGSGPKTSAGRRQMPPESHVHGANGAARCGQSAAVLHVVVQLSTTRVADESHAAAAMHAEVSLASHGASAFTHTFVDGVPTPMQP
jgi:hypothetical protein